MDRPTIFSSDDSIINLAVDLTDKPEYLSDLQWTRMTPEYRALFVDSYGFDGNETITSEEIVARDMLKWYGDDLKRHREINWISVIVECDRDRWTCFRSSDRQRIAVTHAIFISGKDPHLNICGGQFETRYKIIALLVYYMSNGMKTKDEDIYDFIWGYWMSMYGKPDNEYSRRFLGRWKAGYGDLVASCEHEQKARRDYKRYKARFMEVLGGIIRLAREPDGSPLTKGSAMYSDFEMICDFLGVEEVLPGYSPSEHVKIHREHPSSQGRPAKNKEEFAGALLHQSPETGNINFETAELGGLAAVLDSLSIGQTSRKVTGVSVADLIASMSAVGLGADTEMEIDG